MQLFHLWKLSMNMMNDYTHSYKISFIYQHVLESCPAGRLGYVGGQPVLSPFSRYFSFNGLSLVTTAVAGDKIYRHLSYNYWKKKNPISVIISSPVVGTVFILQAKFKRFLAWFWRHMQVDWRSKRNTTQQTLELWEGCVSWSGRQN